MLKIIGEIESRRTTRQTRSREEQRSLEHRAAQLNDSVGERNRQERFRRAERKYERWTSEFAVDTTIQRVTERGSDGEMLNDRVIAIIIRFPSKPRLLSLK